MMASRRVGMSVRAIAPGIAFLLLPGSLVAQERAAGVVRDSASGAPIPGAVVIVADSAGGVRRQLLTDAQGRFSVAVDAAWPGLRVLKLGFSPVELTGNAWHGKRSLDIRLAPFAFVLEAVQTKASSICQADEGVAGVTASLWEQARAGLLAGVVGRNSLPATATVASYHRVYDPNTNRLLSQWETRSSGRGQRAFGAVAPASVLMRTGFVKDDGGSRQYYVPDAEVLLDPRFSAAHCFGIAPASKLHPGEIGLTFRPASSADHALPDVTGTLWLAVDPPELRSLTFEYVNIERSAEQAGAGGTLEYRTMGNGVVVLSTWSLLAPAVTELRGRRNGVPVKVGDSVRQVDRIGGVLVHAAWPDGETYHATLGSILGRIVRGDRVGGTPAPGIRVWIDSTSYQAVTDSLGWFRIQDVLPGSYTVRSRDVALAEFNVEPDLEAKVTAAQAADTLPVQSLPTYADIVARTCGRGRASPATALLLGAMNVGGQAPGWPVDLSITWPGIGTSTVGHQTVSPASQGRFHVCGVPQGRVLSIRAQRDTVAWLDTVTTVPPVPVGVLKLDLGAPGARAGRIIGFVGDSAGRPVPAAEILVLGAPTVMTDSLGNFVVRAVPSGRVLIRVRKFGFAPRALATSVAPGATTSAPVVLTRLVQQLDTVVATGRSDGLQMPDYHGIHKFDLFYQRRAQAQGGMFYTHSDIEQKFPPRLSDLLQGTARRLPRCQNVIMGETHDRDAGAIYQLFIDGVPYGSAGTDFVTLDAIPPSQVEGMAVYTSPTQLPVEAMGNGCAAIFIWTRSVVTDSGMP